MPELFKLLARNAIIGVLAGLFTTGLLVATNTGGLWDVLAGDRAPLLPLIVLAAGLCITFGSISMGVAVMTLPYDQDEGKDKGLKVATLPAMLKAWLSVGREPKLLPVPVKDRERGRV